jgi:hypothetical protein
MPRRLELEALEAELAALVVLLTETKELNDPIGIIQYEQRKQELEEEIRDLRDVERHHASLALFFGGKPVFGSRGIAADFAGKALENFQEIVSKRFAKTELGAIGERGRVPLKDITTLMVTGVTQGSFGFLLDELSDQTQMFDTALKDMVMEVLYIIESTGSSDEIVFEEAAETLDPRTLIALRDFFVDLDSSAATVRLVDEVRDFSLDEAAVHRARVRTEATQIEEEDTEITGTLMGFLPEHRRFEIQIPSGETIYGSATKESTEQYSLTLQSGNPAIGKRCIAKIKERIVRPLNRPSRIIYRLLEFTTLGQEDT